MKLVNFNPDKPTPQDIEIFYTRCREGIEATFDPDQNPQIKPFSYHYMELKKKNLLDSFFENIRKVRDAGCSFTLEVTPSDELIPYIEDMKECAVRNVGAMPHITIARDERNPKALPILTNLSRKEYESVWSQFDSKMIEYKLTIFEQKRHEFCYAGDWSFYLNLLTGDMTQCYKTFTRTNIFKNPDDPIKFQAIGNNCREYHCYNGHSYIILGDIPELKAPTYADIRNRVCIDGSEWLKPKMKGFMSTKLFETNEEYSTIRKLSTNMKMKAIRLLETGGRVLRKAETLCGGG